MRILLLTPQRPYPPHQGTTLRNFNLVKELAKRHPVCVLTFLEPDQNPNDPGPLPDLCEWIETIPVPQRNTSLRLCQMLTTTRPDMSWRLWSPALNERLVARLNEQPFDVVEIEGIEMAPYLPAIEAAQSRPLIVYDAHNAEWILQKRAFLADIKNPLRWPAAAYSWVQWHRLRRYEANLLRRVAHTVAMSAPDKVALRDVVSDAPITVVPNGVDFKAYSQFKGTPIHYDLLFTGKMDFRPNIDAALWFGQQVLPLIQAERPRLGQLLGDAYLIVLGKDDPGLLLPVSQGNIVDLYLLGGVKVTGHLFQVIPGADKPVLRFPGRGSTRTTGSVHLLSSFPMGLMATWFFLETLEIIVNNLSPPKIKGSENRHGESPEFLLF